MPKQVTATMTKSLRAGKVFLDWSQNSSAKTTIAPYSMRGREHPTVAAPRTWEEIEDPDLRHLRFDEVLERVERDGDLLAGLDENVPGGGQADHLPQHARRRQDPGAGAERPPATGNDDTFVIQEHHARRLHYDFRLERDGVLVSWAVPKNLPDTPSVNHLAVHTEDHPLEYGTFEGIDSQGRVRRRQGHHLGLRHLRDREVQDDGPTAGKGGEVIVTLHGNRIDGRYALIQTDGKNWLAHRTKEDARLLTVAGALPVERIMGVETGGCPHTAIREDASINLAAIATMRKRFPALDIVLVESGGDNLAATFSPELADLTIYVIDVAGGEKIPRKGGPGITRSDLLVVNKIDLAPYVGADLAIMEEDTKRMRGQRPYVFSNIRDGVGVEAIAQFIEKAGGLSAAI